MFSDNGKASLLMCASMAGFAVNDAMLKLLFETLPVSQTLFLRGLVASALLVGAAWWFGALSFRPTRREAGPLVLRALGELGVTACFMVALANMPLANATAVLQVSPLAVTMAAAVFLGEPVGWRRWTAIGVGFFGMLWIVRPGAEGFNVFAIAAVGAVVFICLRDLSTRQMSNRTPTLWVSAMSAVLITLCSAALIPVDGWEPVDMPQLALLLGAALMVIAGYTAGVAAMRVGEVGAVAPFRYTVLLWAIALGYLIFSEVPDAATLLGASIVTFAGFYTLWRERRVDQSTAARASNRPFSGTARGKP